MKKKTVTPKKPRNVKQPDSAYWQGILDNIPSISQIWLEQTQAINKKVNFKVVPIPLNQQLIKSLKNFSSKKNISQITLIIAAWAYLINRFSTTDDVTIGMGEMNEEKEFKHCSILMPLRSQLHENLIVSTYLTEMENTLKNHKKNQKNLPTIKHHELFRYLILTNVKTKIAKKHLVNSQQHPLILSLISDNPLKLNLIYNNALFTLADIKRIVAHLVLIIEKFILNYDENICRLSILTREENNKLLKTWNKPISSYPKTDYQTTLHDVFSKQAHLTPNNVAVNYHSHYFTYQQIDEQSNQVARLLQQKKIKPGDTVVVLMERNPSVISVMLGIFKVGAIYVPINPKYPDERIEFILEDCNTHLILANNPTRIPKTFLYKTSILSDNLHETNLLPKLPLNIPVTPQQIAYVIYTSGTTGNPKGVAIKHESLMNLVCWYKKCYLINSDDRSAQFASQGFDTFFCETAPYLAVGAGIYIIDDNSKLTPQLFFNWIVENKITICDLPTAYALILASMKWPDKLSLRHVKIGGEMLAHYPAQTYPFDIWNNYGPTEATVEATFMRVYQANLPSDKRPSPTETPPIGKPIPNSEVYVVDHHMEIVPLGCVGELLIGGVVISPGYLNRTQLTRDKFIWNKFSEDPEAKLYRTGDLVRWREDGTLDYIGRIDHQVKIRGYRIELSEIETTIRSYPDVSEVVVLVNELINKQKTLVAYLVPNMDKIRIPYQERCLVSMDSMHYMQAISEDISKEGIAITGLMEDLPKDKLIGINIKLPGKNEGQWLQGKIIWQSEHRAGIKFELKPEQKQLMNKSIEFYLSSHNLMETLQSANVKRSLRKALKNKLPEYMVPSAFSVLPKFPLTFNGKIDWKSLPPPQDFERLLERKNVAPRTPTEEKVADIWKKVLGLNHVSITDNFFDLGGTSLTVSELSVNLLAEFNISIPAKIFFDLPFIPVIAEFIDSNGKEYNLKSTILEEIQRDAILRDDFVPVGHLSQNLHKPEGILLTGAAGFLGIYLLRELLKKTEAKIFCLVRKGEFESVAKRITSNIDHYQLGDEISLTNRRIILIPSDIGLDQFGVSLDQYNSLAAKVDTIYHCGAQVNTMASYINLRNSNVQGTIEVIKFAISKVDKPIHYISTLSSAYRLDEQGNYAEVFPDGDSTKLVGGYALSKWVSERLLTQMKARGLPVSIYRSGYILGQSDTGITNTNDALLLLVKGCIQLGFAPRWKEKIMILPVDFVSAAIVGISLFAPENSNVYHIEHYQGIMWADLVEWLNDYGFSIKLCSHAAWLEKLSQITPENALYPFLPSYLSQTEEPCTPDANIGNSLEILKQVDLYPYPAINDKLLRSYMNYLCQIGFLPQPQRGKPILTN